MILKYIKDILSPLGFVVQASNGVEAYDFIKSKVPTIIVSDLMMPEMDGIELCQKVKNDIRYRHIPFLLLTASNSEKAKREVYKAGAEGFISKPFNSDILIIRIKRLIEDSLFINSQIEEWTNSKRKVIEDVMSVEESSFEQNIQSIIDEYLSEQDFNVNILVEKMQMSKTSFYNRVKEVTGKSPIEYINYYKLLKSKEYLLQGKYNISEIAYNLGYTDPSYFARVFKKEFGCTPSVFLNSIIKSQE